MNYITFDIETYSPSGIDHIDTNEFRVSVAGAYISWIDEYLAFIEDDVVDLIELMTKADLVVGYNHLWFDLPVIQKYAGFDLNKLPVYDIMVEFEKVAGYKAKLNDLCKANLTKDIKTDSYENFKHYYKEEKWTELIDYCMNDVRLTENLFRIISKGFKVKYYDLHQQKEVLLSQPKPGKFVGVEQIEAIF